MPRQLCCLGMCNISWWSFQLQQWQIFIEALLWYCSCNEHQGQRGTNLCIHFCILPLHHSEHHENFAHIKTAVQIFIVIRSSDQVLLNYREDSFHYFFNSIKTLLVGRAVVVVGHPYMYSHWGPLCTAGSSAMQHSHSWHICLSHSYAGTMNHTQPQRQLKKSSQTSW